MFYVCTNSLTFNVIFFYVISVLFVCDHVKGNDSFKPMLNS